MHASDSLRTGFAKTGWNYGLGQSLTCACPSVMSLVEQLISLSLFSVALCSMHPCTVAVLCTEVPSSPMLWGNRNVQIFMENIFFQFILGDEYIWRLQRDAEGQANLHLAAADDKHCKLGFFISLWRPHKGSPAQLYSHSLRTSEQRIRHASPYS